MKGIIDTTLREGEQAAHVYFSTDDKLKIIKLLDKTGVEEIEAGIAMGNPEIKKLCFLAKKDGCRARLSLWCRCLKKDIEESLACFPDRLNLSICVSDIQIKNKIQKNRKWVLEKVKEAVSFAKSKTGIYLSLGLEDASRADFDFIADVCAVAEIEGVNRIRFSDTLGILDPVSVFDLIKKLKQFVNVDTGVHMHNDFGMATANAVSAVIAGADFADVSVNGLGERAGIASTEEIAAFMAKRKNKKYSLKYLRRLSKYVEKASKISVSPKKPVVGDDIFTCESGIHIDGLIKNPINYEPYNPCEVGLERKFLTGKKTGKNALHHKLNTLGVMIKPESMDYLLKRLKKKSDRLMKSFTDEELLEILI